MQYWYRTAYPKWGDEEAAAVARVLHSGQYTMGPEVEEFESEFASYHGMKHGIMVNSGSSANLLMVAALCHRKEHPLRRGDKVGVPALAWATTYAPLIQYGLELVLLDCDNTWNADGYNLTGMGVTHSLSELRLVVGCSILGNPADLQLWKQIADSSGAYFIVDNCESLGARTSNNALCGTFGLMSSASFFYSHQISAIEGGMVLTNDDECAVLCRMLRSHGWTRDVKKPASFGEEYDFQLFGYNVRPLEMHAAVAREQLKKVEAYRKLRCNNHKLFVELAADRGLFEFIDMQGVNGITNPFGIAFTVQGKNAYEAETRRLALVNYLRPASIDCRLPTGGSFHLHKYGAPWLDQPTPIADTIHKTGLFLGNGPLDLSEQILHTIDMIENVMKTVM